jgi:hypothetical protein
MCGWPNLAALHRQIDLVLAQISGEDLHPGTEQLVPNPAEAREIELDYEEI